MGGFDSEMHVITGRNQAAAETYRKAPFCFPLIGAVLEGTQDGVICTESAGNNSTAYVEHSFGFSQLFGDPQWQFWQDLKFHLVNLQSNAPMKVRLYNPEDWRGLDSLSGRVEISERQRFQLRPDYEPVELCKESVDSLLSIRRLKMNEVGRLDSVLNISTRFWRTASEFVVHGRPIVAWVGSEPASICYAAAVFNGLAEIDVLTMPEYRKQGLALKCVQQCIRVCIEDGIRPVWDCFTNNRGSMALRQSAEFYDSYGPYRFLTIYRGEGGERETKGR